MLIEIIGRNVKLPTYFVIAKMSREYVARVTNDCRHLLVLSISTHLNYSIPPDSLFDHRQDVYHRHTDDNCFYPSWWPGPPLCVRCQTDRRTDGLRKSIERNRQQYYKRVVCAQGRARCIVGSSLLSTDDEFSGKAIHRGGPPFVPLLF